MKGPLFDPLNTFMKKQEQQAEILRRLIQPDFPKLQWYDPSEQVRGILYGFNATEEMASRTLSNQRIFEDVLKVTSPYSPLLDKPFIFPWVNQANELLDKVIREPFKQLSLMFVRTGLDSPDIHTEQFLQLVEAFRAQDEENPTIHSEPLIRLLTAYDIVLVIEREIKTFIKQSIESELEGEWWLHVNRKVRDNCASRRSERELQSNVEHHDFDYALTMQCSVSFRRFLRTTICGRTRSKCM